MSVGIQPSKSEIDTQAGDICRRVNQAFELVGNMKFWLDGVTDEKLIALGYSSDEVSDLKASFARLDALRGIYEGTAAQGATPEDFRAFPRRLWSFGF